MRWNGQTVSTIDAGTFNDWFGPIELRVDDAWWHVTARGRRPHANHPFLKHAAVQTHNIAHAWHEPTDMHAGPGALIQDTPNYVRRTV